MGKNEPRDQALYEKTKRDAKKKFDVWPSAYASGWLVQEYKRRYREKYGAKSNPYRDQKSERGKPTDSDLDRWFEEDWRNVCEKDSRGNHKPCGRASAKSKSKYPYCRPKNRVNSKTPTTISELSRSEIQSICRRKKGPKRIRLDRSSGSSRKRGGSVVRRRRSRKKSSDENCWTRPLAKCVSCKVPTLVDEGYPVKQAVAIAYSMCRRRLRK